jgi:hypothetical protein
MGGCGSGCGPSGWTGLPCSPRWTGQPFVVESPEDLRDHVQALARWLANYAFGDSSSGSRTPNVGSFDTCPGSVESAHPPLRSIRVAGDLLESGMFPILKRSGH